MRDRPVLTTCPYKCHSIRDQRWRYIQYADGTEEFYDHQADPHEWHNLAGDAQYQDVINTLKQWLPKDNAEHVGVAHGWLKWKQKSKENQDHLQYVWKSNTMRMKNVAVIFRSSSAKNGLLYQHKLTPNDLARKNE